MARIRIRTRAYGWRIRYALFATRKGKECKQGHVWYAVLWKANGALAWLYGRLWLIRVQSNIRRAGNKKGA